MNASELYKAGKLQDAIDAQIKEVKSNPADQNKRMFLFDLLAFAGDLDRARKQIEALSYTEVELAGARLQYRDLLDAEQLRRKVFSDGQKPQFLLDPPEHVQQRLDALALLRDHRNTEAQALLQQANQAAPVLKGELNGKAFSELSDYDDRFGTVLEVMVKGIYRWLPLEQVTTIACSPPRLPHDLIWFPARIELRDGSTGEVFMPALYPNSHVESDELVKLGRVADWKSLENGPTIGVGPHQFLAGDAAVPLLEWRELKISA